MDINITRSMDLSSYENIRHMTKDIIPAINISSGGNTFVLRSFFLGLVFVLSSSNFK